MAEADSEDRLTGPREEWLPLMREVDLPLMPGFMTAGYTALGHYIYLAAATKGEDKARQARGADPATVADVVRPVDKLKMPYSRPAKPALQLA